ncbi:MAG: NTP transferase domain-containing protein [Flavobacteriaceae bacterium]|nr:NTP transferase domain-containing protein [Flavobacteriaceae bacterium]
MKHQKHKNLSKRENGNFAPNEISVLGTKCSIITDLVQKIVENIKKKHKIAYFDASHNFEKETPRVDIFTFNKNGFVEKTEIQKDNPYHLKIVFNAYDLVFINGNHYQAQQQILILDNEKEASILKRLEQLDNIQFVIKLNKNSNFFDFLIEKYPHIKNLKCYDYKDIESISKHTENLIQQKTASINGLILIGGKSTRMGTDKSKLDYHGKPQRKFLVDLLSNSISKNNIFYSVRDENQLYENQVITDKFINFGPFGGICSAFIHNPNKAWLVIATDLPFIDKKTIDLLLTKRNSSKIATTFKGKNKKFPEPLITIWEPRAYPILLNYLAQGYSCPRKVLINNDVEVININDDLIENVNTKEAFNNVKKTNIKIKRN